MLAKLARELPTGAVVYEPKWDGFRCLVFRDGDDVDLRSRNGNPFARYFPELVAGFGAVAERRFVVDGEILVLNRSSFDFSALLARTHPAASRVELLARETPAVFVAFDCLAAGGDDLMDRPFAERREALVRVLGAAAAPVFVTPATGDVDAAALWLEGCTDGIDGVIVKEAASPYLPGKRAMVKVKPERTADCVVAGVRLLADRPAVSSLLLGLYDDEGQLRHVGVTASFTRRRREELLVELQPCVRPLEGHPWEHGFGLEGGALGRMKGTAGRWTPDMEMDWVPLAPERVAEVRFDQVEGIRFRHPAQFKRWRPDREARSCTLEQLP